MKFEKELMAAAAADPMPVSPPTVETRRAVRVASDLLLEAVETNTLRPVIEQGCTLMAALGHAMNLHDMDPQVPHLMEAIRALTEDARTVFDAGLRVDDKDKTMVGAVMLELLTKGVFALLNVDYEQTMTARYTTKETSNGSDLQENSSASGTL